MNHPWPAGAATGIGSLPGDESIEAAQLVFGELPDLPHLPELPRRGPGADMIGRTASILVDLPVETVPSGWRIATHAGRELRRSRDFLARDLDAIEQVGAGYSGAVKVQVVGPWTLASNLELASGHRAVSDPGAVRDLTDSLAEGLRAHVADIASRLPGAQVVAQVDEPGVVAVLAGEVPTPSGYGTVRSVKASIVEQGLRTVLDAAPAAARVVHCCAPAVPYAILRAAGANAISIDAGLLTTADYDELGAAIDAGVSLWLGVLPSTDAEIDQAGARSRIDGLWRALGFPQEDLAASIVVTPTCGLADASLGYARRAMQLVREVGASLREDQR